jgi:cytidine deaminase
MMEFCNPKSFKVIAAISPEEYKVYTLEELLPLGFGPETLA